MRLAVPCPSGQLSAFGGKADMGRAPHMSAFDPKRTSPSALSMSADGPITILLPLTLLPTEHS